MVILILPAVIVIHSGNTVSGCLFQEYNFSPVYHSNNDTVTNLDPGYCAEVIRASTAVTVSFATMLSPPVNLETRMKERK